MKCIESCDSILFPWHVFFLGVRLYVSQAYRKMDVTREQGAYQFVAWHWEKYSCHSKLVCNGAILETISGMAPSTHP